MKNLKKCCFSSVQALGGRAVPILVIAILGWASVGAKAAGDSLPEHSAYTEMLRADRMREAEDSAGARIAYRTALELFEALRTSRPDYKPAVMEHRMDYCRGQIAALPQDAAPIANPIAAPPESVEVLIPPEIPVSEADLELRRREEALKVSLVGLQLERDRMREEMKRVEAERDLAMQMLAEAGRKTGQESGESAVRDDELKEKTESVERAEKLLQQARQENERLREQVAASEENSARWKAEVETVRAAGQAKWEKESQLRKDEHAAYRLELKKRTVAQKAGTPEPEEAVVEPLEPEDPAPVDPQEQMARIEAWIEAGQFDPAAAACRAILQEDPVHPDAGYGLARIAWKAGDKREARRVAGRLSTSAPERGDIQFFCGEVFQDATDLRKAIRCYEAAVACDASSIPYRKALAEAYFEAGRIEDAVSAFRALTELDSRDGAAQFNLAALLVKLDDPELLPEARNAYRVALELGEPRAAVLDRKLGVSENE
jgi:tetratricopeptide (TPR) repeat protein